MTALIRFPVFVAVWNRVQNFSTPAVHARMAGWLDRSCRENAARLLLMAFRSCGKSTIVGLYAAWRLYRDPNCRILVVAADLALARKMVRNVKRILERHPLTAGLKPERADQWGASRFTVKRPAELRDPSMLARGVDTNITGSRADLVICDDVEVPGTADTHEKRLKMRERLSEISFVLVPGGGQLYVGTPHAFDTLYQTDDTDDPSRLPAFLKGFDALRIPVLDADGQSAWPERFSRDDIDRIRESGGPLKFASQMMLEPVPLSQGRLDSARLVPFASEPVLTREWQQLSIDGRRVRAAHAYWDPAFGSPNGDRSALACVYTDTEGHYWLTHVVYLQTSRAHTDDEATQQCAQVAALCRDWHVPVLGLETNGLGRFLPAILRRAVADIRAPVSVVEIHQTRSKDSRILEAWDAPLAAGRIHAHRRLWQTPFIREMQEWRPGLNGARDDGLDAVAGALALAPAFITGAARLRPAPSWKGYD